MASLARIVRIDSCDRLLYPPYLPTRHEYAGDMISLNTTAEGRRISHSSTAPIMAATTSLLLVRHGY